MWFYRVWMELRAGTVVASLQISSDRPYHSNAPIPATIVRSPLIIVASFRFATVADPAVTVAFFGGSI